ncbi:MAG: UbiD family decarboxylase [Deltaproteobacteria bacterium]
MTIPADLQELIRMLERAGELIRIREPVSARLEIAALTDLVSQNRGPAILFEQVKGFDMPVLTNAFGTERRMALALGIRSLQDLDAVNGEFLASAPDVPDFFVLEPPCQEIVLFGDDVDLTRLPALHAWPKDAGPALTLPIVVTRHPETGARNVGMYRLQILGPRTTGMHWRTGSGGAKHYNAAEGSNKRLAAAVALGADPACTLAACSPLPEDQDEFVYAGVLRGTPVPLARCRTVDLEVPASSQIVLEGYLEPGERRVEGPFAMHTGLYDLPALYPVFHVTCATFRRDAVFPATVVGPPPKEDCFLAKAAERLLLARIQKRFPEVRDLNLPVEGIFQNIAFISIEKSEEGQPFRLITSLRDEGFLAGFRFICAFGADDDIRDLSRVLWLIGNRVDPARDLVQGTISGTGTGCLDVDCTRKSERFGRPWPEEAKWDPETMEKAAALSARLGLMYGHRDNG